MIPRPAKCLRSPPAASQRSTLHPGPASICPGLTLTRRFGGSLTFTRPAFPLATPPDGSRVASASSLSFAPHRYRRRTERGRAIEHLPGLHHRRHRRPPNQRATCTCDFVSHTYQVSFARVSNRCCGNSDSPTQKGHSRSTPRSQRGSSELSGGFE